MNDFLKEAFSSEWVLKYLTEFIATAFLVALGNGAVANVELKGTKGNKSGWIVIAFGYGFGVMMPALMFGDVSGNHINPAFTLGLAASGLFSWVGVPGYLIAQLLGAFVGQAIVVWVHQPYYVQTENPNNILGTFSTISAVDDHDDTPENRNRAWANGFVNEFAGSFLLFFGALALTNNYFGHKLAQQALAVGYTKEMVDGQFHGALETAHIGVGFLVAALVLSFGGPTGPALNPARDLMPRLLHHILPTTVLGEHKGDSRWWYAWVPVVAPILAGVLAPQFVKYIGRSRTSTDIQNAQQIATALSTEFADTERTTAVAQQSVTNGATAWDDATATVDKTNHRSQKEVFGGVPKVKAKSGYHFVYEITEAGEVKVSVTDGTNTTDLYPEAKGDWAK